MLTPNPSRARRAFTPRARRAFTLIELLVVILILSILAALIIPRLVGRTSDAKIAKARSDIATISSLLQQYRMDNDRYPTTEQGLAALRVRPPDAPNWKGPYTTKDVPLDPWGNPYVYQTPGPDGQDFLITSYGADGAPGGDGDAADITSDQ
ncbi:MAG: type II secretion system major pseudopilin GspG [Armatimonadetes bacterium]|nr:type II secretion system major pseudopilin GspG [Armatimonadota bacterium]